MELFVQITAVLGVIATIFFGIDAIRHRRKNKKLLRASTNFDWEQMLVAANVISKEMRQAEFSPGLIIAVQGGGGIFAQLLSIELGEDIPITIIHLVPKDVPKQTNESFLVKQTNKWQQFIPRYLAQFGSGQKVTIIDDFCISGDTLASLRDGLIELGIVSENIVTAAPICTQQAVDGKNGPNFCWQEVDCGRVNFPWGPGQKLQRMGQAPSMAR